MKNVISIRDFSREKIEEIIVRAEEMIPYAEKEIRPPDTPGKKAKVVFAFYEPSTRTKGSYNQAARILGYEREEISGTEATSLMKKESLGNTIRMLATQGAKIIVMRTPWEGAPRFATEVLHYMGEKISVQNAGDGANQHPTQTLLDLVTIKQTLGRLENFKLGLVGDLKHSRTVHSLLQALRHFPGIELLLYSTVVTELQENYKAGFEKVCQVSSLEELAGCDIVYATRLQRERFKNKEELERAEGAYLINKKILDRWGNKVRVMHPLPCVDEISPEIYYDPRILMYKQAWYGIPTRMSLLLKGYKHRFDPTSIPAQIEPEIKVIKKGPQRKSKKGKRFVPIQTGTVIDHLREDTVDKVKILLRKAGALPRGMGPIQTLEEAGTGKIQGAMKEILVLENRFISWKLAATVKLISPEVTFNVFKEGIHKKVKVELPNMVPELFKCPNPDCITNCDPEAKTRFSVHGEDGNTSLACNYCERAFSSEEVISCTF